MLRLREWQKEAAIKKKDKKNGKQHNHQGSGAFGNVHNQGEANRPHQEVPEPIIHFFPEP